MRMTKTIYCLRVCLAICCCLLTKSVSAQELTVHGRVVDAEGEPVVGATITYVDNDAIGVATDYDGNYQINIDSKGSMKVEAVGLKTQIIEVSGRTQINITMETDVTLIDEVVVVGYGTMKKSDLTGAVASVGEKVFQDRPHNNIGQALQGRAAGVYIVDSGNPQDNVSIKIRGLGTVNNSNPLFVVDGVPMTIMGINSLNPEDIESLNVLKDASATAIYGARGANGVVMITTRKGKGGEGSLTITSNFGMSTATDVPVLLNASEYAALNNEMMTASLNKPNPEWVDPTILGEGTDWLDAMLRTAYSRHYTFAYTGGKEGNTHYISAGYTTHDGIINSVEYRRATFQYNGENQVKNWLTMSTNITLSYDDKANGDYSIGDLMQSVPVVAIMDENGQYDGPSGNALWYGDKANQVGKSNINTNVTNGYNFLGTETAEIKLFDGLTFKSVGSIGASFVYSESFRPAYDWRPNPLLNSERYKSTHRYLSYLWDNYFTYKKIFGLHDVNVMVGSGLQWGWEDWFDGQKKGFLSDTASQFNNGTVIESLNGTKKEWAIASFMGRLNYSFSDRYLVTASLRYDGSSKFGPGHRWGLFPSFSAAWRLNEESWFPATAMISNLKLRAGYGVTGNQEIGDYSFVSVYNTGQYSFNGNVVNSLVPKKLSNQNIHWEEVAQSNIGVDLGLWNNRLTLSIDAYIKNTNGMLVAMVVPISSGYSDSEVPYTNAGKVHNEGLELTITSDNLRESELSWQTEANISFNRNRIVSLDAADALYYNDAGFGQYFCTNTVGEPIGSFFGYTTNGLFQTKEEATNYATQPGASAGDIRFKDLDNNGVINEDDRQIIGNPQPKFTFALNNTLSWHSFDLEVYLQGVYGNTIYNALKVDMESMSTICNQYISVLGRWNGEGSSTVTPRAIYGDPNNNNRPSTRYLEDGSYLRLKNLTLGYTLPQGISKQLSISKFRLYLAASNLATLTNYSGFDPEVGNDGIDWGTYPITRTLSFGLDLKF